jgi:hypothetical protein
MPDFTNDNPLTPSVQAGIRDYVEALKVRHDNWIGRAQIALKHFSENVEKGEVEQAGSDFLVLVITEAFDFGTELLVNEIAGKVPGGSTFVSFTKGVADSLVKKLDTSGVSVLGFIQAEESSLLLLKQAFDKRLKDDFQEELEVQFMGAPDADQFIKELDVSINAAGDSSSLPHPDRLERVICEEWINRHFSKRTDDGMGCIDYRIEATKTETGFDAFVASVTLQAPHGNKLAPRLNKLIDAGHAGLAEVGELAVRKRICYCVEVVGNTWDCGWLDQRNKILHQPLTDAAREFLKHKVGFLHIIHFRVGNGTSCSDIGLHDHAK